MLRHSALIDEYIDAQEATCYGIEW